jgi:signal transduction histidine kinase
MQLVETTAFPTAISESTPFKQERSVEQLEALLQTRERQIEAIQRISNALFTHASVDDMVQETLAVAIQVLDADVGSILMHDAEKDSLIFRYVQDPAATHLVGLAIPTSQGIAGHVFRTGKSDLSQKVSNKAEFSPVIDEIVGYKTDSMLTVPLKHFNGQPYGVMQVLNARIAFDLCDLEVLEVLCGQAAMAVESARLAQESRKAEIVNVLGDVSHDIKNMLTPIQSGVMTILPFLDQTFEDLDHLSANGPELGSWSDAIGEATSLTRENYQWILENALDAADRVQARTKEIADAVKGELAPPNFESAVLNDTAQQVAQSLRPVAEESGIELRLDLDGECPVAQFDPKQIYNLLYNLVNNAIPETPAGGMVVVRTRALPEEKALLLEVSDTGGGIPEHVRERLFTDRAISTKPGGTGLGTRIIADIARRHGAKISVESEEGHGATFSVQLPLRQTCLE